MSVDGKRPVKSFVVGGVFAVLCATLFCLVAVSSRRFGDFRAVNVDSVSRRDSVLSSRSSSDTCTADVLRNYFRTMDYFPGGGRWQSSAAWHSSNSDNISGTPPPPLHRFVPDLCLFHFDGFRSLPAANARRCLRRRNVTRITTVGDSNAARYYAALLTALADNDGRWRCVNVAAEAVERTMLIPDVRYFARYDRRLLPLLLATTRHCSSCGSTVHRCSRQNTDVNKRF